VRASLPGGGRGRPVWPVLSCSRAADNPLGCCHALQRQPLLIWWLCKASRAGWGCQVGGGCWLGQDRQQLVGVGRAEDSYTAGGTRST
jgi:hypothetical protein